jgi:hypothetical protein
MPAISIPMSTAHLRLVAGKKKRPVFLRAVLEIFKINFLN